MIEKYTVTYTDDISTTWGVPVLREEWRKAGKLSRNGAPAVTVTNKADGTIYLQEFWKGGKRHNDLGPARIENFVPDEIFGGLCRIESYYKSGLRHRDHNLPAIQQIFLQTGRVCDESWFKHGRWYRDEDLPCRVLRDPHTGIPIREIYTEPEDDATDPEILREIIRDEFTGIITEDVRYYNEHTGLYEKGVRRTVWRDGNTGEPVDYTKRTRGMRPD